MMIDTKLLTLSLSTLGLHCVRAGAARLPCRGRKHFLITLFSFMCAQEQRGCPAEGARISFSFPLLLFLSVFFALHFLCRESSSRPFSSRLQSPTLFFPSCHDLILRFTDGSSSFRYLLSIYGQAANCHRALSSSLEPTQLRRGVSPVQEFFPPLGACRNRGWDP